MGNNFADKKRKAFALYCLDITLPKIAERLGLNRTTVYKWEQKYGWAQDKQEYEQMQLESSTLSTNQRHKKLVREIEELWTEAINIKRDRQLDKISARDLLEAMKMERLIEGLTTDNVRVESNEIWDVKKEFNKWLNESEDEETESDSKESKSEMVQD